MEIRVEQAFGVPASVLYNTFLSQHDWIRLALGAPTMVDDHVGGEFCLFGGSIRGVFLALDPNKSIEEKWRFSDWGEGVYSKVLLEFESRGPESVLLKITQTEIPEKDKFGNTGSDVRCKEGWKQNVFDRIEKILGYPRIK